MQVEAARSVMIELVGLLGEYHDDFVIVGGWVPALLIPQDKCRHIGSIDVDLALNHTTLRDPGYKTLRKLLVNRGYKPDDEQPFIFWRKVSIGNRDIEVEVDLLAGEYEGTGKSHRTQVIQDVRARKARGCELAFLLPEEITLEWTLPNGSRDRTVIRIAGIVPFLAMNGMAMANRLKEKDPWDIYYCVRYYPEGIENLATVVAPHLDSKLVREGLLHIASNFTSPEQIGPRSVADFEEVADPEDRSIINRDAFERVFFLLQKLGII